MHNTRNERVHTFDEATPLMKKVFFVCISKMENTIAFLVRFLDFISRILELRPSYFFSLFLSSSVAGADLEKFSSGATKK